MAKKIKKLTSQSSVNSAVKAICDIMRRSNCAGALKYVPELTWILFLRILDEREERETAESEAVGRTFTPALTAPYRWRDWAAPKSPLRDPAQGGTPDKVWKFVHEDLLPTLRGFGAAERPASARQRLIAQILSGTERSRVDSAKNFCDVLDKVHEISSEVVVQTHLFTLSQVYEGLLLKMGEKGNDGGQFFTPREVIRVMVRTVGPRIGQTVYDPGCGTGGFLAQAYEHMRAQAEKPQDLDTLKHTTFFGREKDDDTYPIALANLLLHGIDEPHIWHGNTLTGAASYDRLFAGAPEFFDVVLMNPPFGGKEGKAAQTHFEFQTGATQCLFLQHVLKAMRPGATCGIVLDEGLLFRTNDRAFAKTKQKLLEDCDVWCIVSLPAGVFLSAGAGVKTNLVFFTKGRPTERIWYYDLSAVKVGRKSPLTLKHFEEFEQLRATQGDSERSWTVDFAARREAAQTAKERFEEKVADLSEQIEQLETELKQRRKARPDDPAIAELTTRIAAVAKESREALAEAQEIEFAIYDLKAVNPHAKSDEDTRTPQELLDFIDAKGREADAALVELRRLVTSVNPPADGADRDELKVTKPPAN
jgi:type I restriction enzyme M protein